MKGERRLRSLFLALGVMVSGGCAPAIVGGGIANYLFAWGGVDEYVSVSPNELYERSLEIASKYGKLIHAKPDALRVKMKYYSSTVWIEIEPMADPKIAKVQITARNSMQMMEEGVAHTIFKYLVPNESFILPKRPRVEQPADSQPTEGRQRHDEIPQ